MTTKEPHGFVPETQHINVQKKTVRAGNNKPPCCTEDLYSFDGGKTWVSAKKYFDWHRNLVHITDLYALDNYIL